MPPSVGARFSRGCAMAGASFAVAASMAASVAQAAFPGRNGRIAMASIECSEGTARIATMRPNGRGLRMLTKSRCGGAVGEASPDWSPDGHRLIFERYAFGQSGIALMKSDGSARTDVPLASDPMPSQPPAEPSFAPDGQRFLYTRYLPHLGGADIWLASIDGRDDRRIGPGVMPRWSPDGRSVAYVVPYHEEAFGDTVPPSAAFWGSRRTGTWLMDARTWTPIRRFTAHPATALDWVPNGRRILLTTSAGDKGAVFLARTDSRRYRRVALGPNAQHAVLSPDGRRVAWVRERYDFAERYGDEGAVQASIWTSDLRGRAKRRIYSTPLLDYEGEEAPELSWQPRAR